MAKAKGKVIVFLECQECGRRTYTLRKPPKAQWKLELSKLVFRYSCPEEPSCGGTTSGTGGALAADATGAAAPIAPGFEVKPSEEAVGWANQLRKHINSLRRELGNPKILWDPRLDEAAAKQAALRGLGVKEQNVDEVERWGYKRPVRVEVLGDAKDQHIREDLGRFEKLDVWDAVARRGGGLGTARIEAAEDPNKGQIVLVVITARRQ